MLAALNCVCGWISIPFGDISITMQTFSVMLTLLLLGGRWGTLTIGVYLLLGAVGIPVFSGFRGGIGVLLGATGGYLSGFLLMGLLYWCITARLGNRGRIAAGVAGLLACYSLGTVWYMVMYLQDGGWAAVLLKCVIPYVLPDALKLAMAFSLADRIQRRVSMN